MSTKALKTQLLAAVAMVLVASVALGSSTYAWFASNKTVTATSATVNASSDLPFLQIAKAEGGAYSTSVAELNASAENLKLVKPLNLTDAEIEYLKSDDGSIAKTSKFTSANNIIWGSTYSSSVTDAQINNKTTEVTSLQEYALSFDLYFRTAKNTTGKDLVMAPPTITSEEESSIANAYRILAVCGSNYMLYNKGDNNVTGNDKLSETIGVEEGQVAYTKVTVYIYFDGTDSVAKTELATNLKNIVSTLNFSCKAASEQ